MEYARIGDVDLCYTVVGEGYPLVMIMGLTANMDWWDPQLVDRLSRSYRLLLFDNRCAGRSGSGEGEVTIPAMAEDTAGLMESLEMNQAHVLGVSMGGMIAQELVLNHSDKVNKLVLCATFCGGQESVYADREVLQKMMDRSDDPEVQVRKTMSLLFPEEWLDAHREYFEDFLERYSTAPITMENAAKQFMATVSFSTWDRLPQVKNQALVATGTEDVVIPPENSRIISDRIPDARLVEFEGAGHGFINQCGTEFLEVLSGFLR
jgi:pimeloyl-ACP methyl ester carboxylesterase